MGGKISRADGRVRIIISGATGLRIVRNYLALIWSYVAENSEELFSPDLELRG